MEDAAVPNPGGGCVCVRTCECVDTAIFNHVLISAFSKMQLGVWGFLGFFFFFSPVNMQTLLFREIRMEENMDHVALCGPSAGVSLSLYRSVSLCAGV